MPHPAEVATVAMSAMAAVLHAAGCLVEPPPPAPGMSLHEAAEVLCRRARHPRLDPNDPDDVASVVGNRHQAEFALAQAGGAADDTDLHTARRLLEAHHGLR